MTRKKNLVASPSPAAGLHRTKGLEDSDLEDLVASLPESLTPVGAGLKYPELLFKPRRYLTGYGVVILDALSPAIAAISRRRALKALEAAATLAEDQGQKALARKIRALKP